MHNQWFLDLSQDINERFGIDAYNDATGFDCIRDCSCRGSSVCHEHLLLLQWIAHCEIQFYWHAALETEEAFLKFSKDINPSRDGPCLFRIRPLAKRRQDCTRKINVNIKRIP